MYTLSEQQIDFILNDIKSRGVVMEDLQLNLLDHVCCIVENELDLDDDLKLEINQKLSGKKRMAIERGDLNYDEAT
jgi:hypothetical protein